MSYYWFRASHLRGLNSPRVKPSAEKRRTNPSVISYFAIGLLLMAAAGLPLQARARESTERLDITKFELTFSEEFNDLSVSARGPGTRWIAHTPWNGDFGDAQFADPEADFPFTISDGVLRIEARREADGQWRSGLLASVDFNGSGFSQQYGFFEMRARLPTGPGVWPAFWLVGVNWAGRGASKTTVEIDPLEYYGPVSPDWIQSGLAVWFHDGSGRTFNRGSKSKVPLGTRFEDFHTYGVLVRSDFVTFYFDGDEIWETDAVPYHYQQPMMILLNLALGSGYPTDQTPNPSHMYVDYVRAYSE